MSDPRTATVNRLLDEQYAATGTIYGTADPAEILGAILSFAAVPFTFAALGLLRDTTAPLEDGSVVDLRPLTETELEAKCRQQDLEGECYRVVQRLAKQYHTP